jgi:acyl carrier protein
LTTPTFERVRGIAADVFGLAPQTLAAASSPETVESWDSTRHLSFILALEETFQLQLSPEETEKIQTLGHAVELVEEKLRAAAE